MNKDKIIELLMTCNKTYLLVTVLFFLIFLIYLLNSIRKYILIRKLRKQKGIRFYYKFLGNIYWLKGEISKKRYLELKYLNPVKAKEEANLIILLEEGLENNAGAISIYMAEGKIILKKLVLNNEQLKKILKNFPHTLVENDEIIKE
ncbi:hypothetical protein [Fusobacterium sp.]|uniref:hypothetical protein n=1 Tax=Fusobacterium sp. TaxID=68766 RepID=UPI0029027087|nr:hypothetical protein [Fusobacterium sp.]MDU1912627.1 hypothetical protein [Fusobacterium sp.]